MDSLRIRTGIAIILTLWGMGITPLSAVSETLAQEKPLIIVGGAINYPPYEFLDADGKPTGYAVELTRAIAEVMKMNVQINLEPSHSIFQALNEGKIHILMDVAYTETRAKNLDFSSPHTMVAFSIFGRKNGPSIGSMEAWHERDVMALKRAVINELALHKGWDRTLTFVDSDEDMLRLLSSGKHDYAILATKVGVHLIRNLGLTNIAPIAETPEIFKYCFAGKKGSREVLDQFNEGLSILYRTGQYKKIRDKWLGDDLNPGGIPWSQVVKFGGLIVAVFLGILLLILVWSRTLKKQVIQRTMALELEIKQRRRTEEELLRNQAQLVQSAKMAEIGTLVSGVAHEINNPNGLILLNLTMLKDMYKDICRITEDRYHRIGDFDIGQWQYSEVRENLASMLTESLEASRRIVRIVEDLKNFSRRDNSDLNEDVDLNVVAGAAVRLLGSTIEKSTDSFVVRCAEDLPKVRGNAQRIEQVIVNLILNACQALPDRSRSISLKTRFAADQRMVALEVADQGTGIAPEHLQRITDTFFTTKRDQGGTGLGLSVSAIIVKEHAGLLHFKSALDAGTTVTLSLPIAGNEESS